MAAECWTLDGDEDLLDGAILWIRSEVIENHVHYVIVDRLSDSFDLPDNIYAVSIGEFPVPTDLDSRRRALEFCGIPVRTATEEQVVSSSIRWSGSLSEESVTTVQVGPLEPRWHRLRNLLSPVIELTEGESLRGWVEENCLGAADPVPGMGR